MSLRKHFTGTSGIASAAILNPENENFQFPTLEPGFDLLSDDWFQVNITETGKKKTVTFIAGKKIQEPEKSLFIFSLK